MLRFGLFTTPVNVVRDFVFARILLKSFETYWDLVLPDNEPEPIYNE